MRNNIQPQAIPKEFQGVVVKKAFYTIPQSVERQPVRSLRVLERRQGCLELQLARQRLEQQQPRCLVRKLFISPSQMRGSFVLRVGHSSHQAFFQFLQPL